MANFTVDSMLVKDDDGNFMRLFLGDVIVEKGYGREFRVTTLFIEKPHVLELDGRKYGIAEIDGACITVIPFDDLSVMRFLRKKV